MSGNSMGTPGKFKDPYWWLTTICLVAIVAELALHSSGVLTGPLFTGITYIVFGLSCVYAAIRKQGIGFRPMPPKNCTIMMVMGALFVILGIVWIVVNPLGL